MAADGPLTFRTGWLPRNARLMFAIKKLIGVSPVSYLEAA
jgi:hypothetical protein